MKIQFNNYNFKGWIALKDDTGNKHAIDAKKIITLTANNKELSGIKQITAITNNGKYFFPDSYTCEDAILLINNARKKPYNHCYDIDYTENWNPLTIDLTV